jgi:hypothetical protein
MNAESEPKQRVDGPSRAADWRKSHCPQCGLELLSETEYVAPRGYVVRLVCPAPGCGYGFTL